MSIFSFRACQALLLAGGLLLSPFSAHAQSHYRGGGAVFGFTSQCDAANWGGPYEWGLARYRPAGAGNNSVDWHRLSFFFGTYAMHFAIPATAQIGEWVTAYHYGIGSYSNTGIPVSVRLLGDLNIPVWNGEQAIRMNILSIDGIDGCDISLAAFLRAAD